MIAARHRIAALGLAAALLVGTSGCSLIGDVMQRKTTLAENLEFQRISAKKFISNWPHTQAIHFIEQGSFDGSGQWSASVLVTIGGEKYEEIIGPWTTIGDDLPDAPSSYTASPVAVTYSDGTTESLR